MNSKHIEQIQNKLNKYYMFKYMLYVQIDNRSQIYYQFDI